MIIKHAHDVAEHNRNKMPQNANPDLSYWEFRALAELMMAADPWPAADRLRPFAVKALNREAQERGYTDWVEAYHDLP